MPAVTIDSQSWSAETLSGGAQGAIMAPRFTEYTVNLDVSQGAPAPTDHLFNVRFGTWTGAGFDGGAAPPDDGYWELAINDATLGAGVQVFEMNWVGSPRGNMGKAVALVNYTAQNEFDSVTFRYYFLAAQDFGDNIRDLNYSNYQKALRDDAQNTNLLDNSYFNDAYSSAAKNINITAFIIERADPANFAKAQGKTPYGLRFYNRDIGDATPLVADGGVALEYDGSPITSISPVGETIVRCRVDASALVAAGCAFPAASGRELVHLFLIRTDTNNGSTDWLNSYEIEYCDLVEAGNTFTADLGQTLAADYKVSNTGVFFGPTSGDWINISGDIYEVSARINGALLQPGATYRIIHVWRNGYCGNLAYPGYSRGAPVVTPHDSAAPNADDYFAFVSDEYFIANPPPTYCDPAPELVELWITDGFGHYNWNVDVPATSRLRTYIRVSGASAYNAAPQRDKLFSEALDSVDVIISSSLGTRRSTAVWNPASQTFTAPAFADVALSGEIYEGLFDFEVSEAEIGEVIRVRTVVKLNQPDGLEVYEYIQQVRVSGYETRQTLTFADADTGDPVRLICEGDDLNLRMCGQHSDLRQSDLVEASTNFFQPRIENDRDNLLRRNENQPGITLPPLSPAVYSSADQQYDPATNQACAVVNTATFDGSRRWAFSAVQRGRGMGLRMRHRDENNVPVLEHARFPHIPAYEIGCNAFTFEVWVWLERLPNAGYSFGLLRKERVGASGGANTPALLFVVTAGGALGFSQINDNTTFRMAGEHPATTACQPGQWLHLVWSRPEDSYQAPQQTLSINGDVQNALSVLDTLQPDNCDFYRQIFLGVPSGQVNDGPFVIGADYDCGQPLSGHITDPSFATLEGIVGGVNIYNRALTPAEIQKQYSLGPSGQALYPADAILAADFNAVSGGVVCDYSTNENDGELPTFQDWQTPNTGNCTPVPGRFWGWRPGRLADGGGAWVMI